MLQRRNVEALHSDTGEIDSAIGEVKTFSEKNPIMIKHLNSKVDKFTI